MSTSSPCFNLSVATTSFAHLRKNFLSAYTKGVGQKNLDAVKDVQRALDEQMLAIENIFSADQVNIDQIIKQAGVEAKDAGGVDMLYAYVYEQIMRQLVDVFTNEELGLTRTNYIPAAKDERMVVLLCFNFAENDFRDLAVWLQAYVSVIPGKLLRRYDVLIGDSVSMDGAVRIQKRVVIHVNQEEFNILSDSSKPLPRFRGELKAKHMLFHELIKKKTTEAYIRVRDKKDQNAS